MRQGFNIYGDLLHLGVSSMLDFKIYSIASLIRAIIERQC
jgi:hypothetical protein